MHLILLGAPGAGKGTQAKLLQKKYHIPQISTGEILRAEVRANTDLGRVVKAIMESGELVSDDIILKIIEHRIQQPDCQNGFILDGFPRTETQAEGLDKLLAKFPDIQLKAIEIALPEKDNIARLTGRRICSQCGKDYNLQLNPPPADNRCTVCGGEIIQRDDDNVETVRHRLDVYHKQTQPLIKYYASRNKLFRVDGNQPVEGVFQEIEKILKNGVQS